MHGRGIRHIFALTSDSKHVVFKCGLERFLGKFSIEKRHSLVYLEDFVDRYESKRNHRRTRLWIRGTEMTKKDFEQLRRKGAATVFNCPVHAW